MWTSPRPPIWKTASSSSARSGPSPPSSSGVTIDRQGYNIFALGPSGTGKYTVIERFVEQRAAAEPPPDDWCYVNDFEQPSMPRALRLPAGMGKELQRDMERLVEELRSGLSSAFESEEYATRRRALEEEFQERQQESLERAAGAGARSAAWPCCARPPAWPSPR